MLILPVEFTNLMTVFAPLFSWRVWQHVQVLVICAILAPGKRTVTAALRVMGLSRPGASRIVTESWTGPPDPSREASGLLLVLLVHTFASFGPLVLGPDDTL